MNIKDVAEQAGDNWNHTLESDKEFLKKFAALVVAHEREECAKLCERHQYEWCDGMSYARAIRARGEA